MIDFHSYHHDENASIRIVEVQGNLDTDAANYFFTCVEQLIEEGQKKIVIDCSKLEYISSLGLGMLMRVHSRMKKIGGNVKIARLEGGVADVFATVGFDKILQLYASTADAVASYS